MRSEAKQTTHKTPLGSTWWCWRFCTQSTATKTITVAHQLHLSRFTNMAKP
jgi:hypothetical protein